VNRRLLVLLGVVFLASAGVLGARALSEARAAARAATPFSGVPFVDQRGERFTFDAFAGKRVLVGFAVASDGTVGACASIAGKFAYAQHRIDPARVHLVEISADPVDDSLPGVLPAYARAYGIDAARWTVASGTVADVSGVDAALVRAAQAAKIADIYGETVAVLDERGRLRGVLDATNLGPDDLVREALRR
jgi:cytochrome oxidase Cu insertion factor (SCO1/SenC/PrrC family)